MKTATKTIEGTAIREADRPADQPLVEQPKARASTKRVATDPMAMLAEIIRQQGTVDPETLDKFTSVAERWRANDAKAAYAAAFVAFKGDAKSLVKDKHVHFDLKGGGVTDYNHLTLGSLCDQIIPLLHKHGLAHRWRVESLPDNRVRVRTMLLHEQGFEEEVACFEGGPDISGSKNTTQGIGSTAAYFERYGLVAGAGLATKEQDDDGRGAGSEEDDGLSEKSFADFSTAIEGAATEESLTGIWQKAAAACFESRDQEAHDTLRAKVVARIRELKAKP